MWATTTTAGLTCHCVVAGDGRRPLRTESARKDGSNGTGRRARLTGDSGLLRGASENCLVDESGCCARGEECCSRSEWVGG